MYRESVVGGGHNLSAPELILRTLVENTGSIVYSYRICPTAKLEYVSPGVEKITGYSQKDFYIDSTLIFSLIHPDDRHSLMHLSQSIVEAPGKAMVLRLWRKDAAMIWIEHMNLPILDEHGNLIGIQGTARDITPQKQLDGRDYLIKEVALMVVEDKPLSAILSYVCEELVNIYGLNMAWIGMKRPDGRVSVDAVAGAPPPANHFVREKLRWDSGHGAAGKVIRSGKTFIVDLEQDIFQPWYDKLIARKIRSVAAFPLKTKGSTLGAVILYSTYDSFFSERVVHEIEDFCGQIALAVNDSITKQQLSLITTGLQSTTSAVIITDCHLLIHWHNPAFGQLTCCNETEIQNSYFNELITGDTLNSAFYTNLRETVLAGSTWRGEIEIPQKNRELTSVEMVVTPVKNEKGKTTHFVIVLHDLTQRKQAEVALQRVAQAEKLASLGRMAAGISHEINQPLNSIKVITDSIQYWHRRGIITEMPDILNAIRDISSQADRIDKIIKHVRNFVHTKNSSSLAPCDLNSAIESVIHLLETQLSSHEIELKQNLECNLPPVAATTTGLEQILINLVVNSIQALETAEKMTKTLQISTFLGDTVIIEVSDNGPGISDNIKDKIFEPFFTANNFNEGMGLGLAITQSIISAYNGKISVITNEQEGATFRVELPVWQQTTQEDI